MKVDFTDADGHDESRTSDAYPAGSTVLPADSVPSDWSLIPTGLSTGDTFRLLFLSSTKRNATSTDIADYNTFVQNRAAAGHTDIRTYSAGFRVVGCTADTDARDNTSTTYTATDKGVPIYWLNGAKAADEYEDFYDGSWDDEANDKNESGTNSHDTSQQANYPFTGCNHDGTESFSGDISRALGELLVRPGRPTFSNAILGPLSSDSIVFSTLTRPMYGLSAVFQVAADTTPPTLTSAGVNEAGLFILLGFSENLQLSNLPPASAFTVTAGGSAFTVGGVLPRPGAPDLFLITVSPAIRQGQAIVVTYTDPTAGDDATAFQDTAGNDAATFTTGSDNVPAVTNASTVLPAAAEVPADWSLKPTAVTAGTQFRLLFLSSTKRDGSSTDIATYNTFIQTRAAAGHTDIQAYSAGFRVVGCTEDTDARDNTETTYTGTAKGVPIYWLDGAKAADEYEDFYDGSWDDEANDKNESGTDAHDTSQTANWPWTGCKHNGTESRQFAGLVSRGLGSDDVRHGRPDSSTVNHGPLNGLQNGPKAETRPLYGLSALFQVAAAVVVPNNPPAGAPTITGTAQVGETLTAVTTAIMDADGLTTPDYVYQWIRVATDNTETYIASARASTYTLVEADQGATIKVLVGFTDDANNSETLTSAATAAVAAAPDTTPPTLVSAVVEADGNILLRFSENLGAAPVLSAFTVTADGSPVTVVSTENATLADDGIGVETSPLIRRGQAVVVMYSDPTAGDDALAIQDIAGNDAADFTTGMNGVPPVTNNSTVNNPATGAPAITGTAQVGETLTATVGTIADVDGLPNPFLTDANTSFQWVRVELGTETNIPSATASTYTLVREDWRSNVGVKVSFRDAQGNSEEPLASTLSGIIARPANTAATGEPGITGTAQVGQTLTATVGSIADVDGLRNPFLTDGLTSFQWIRVATDNTETNIASATASTYTLVTGDAGTTIKVTVGFVDNYDYDEMLTSAETGAVSAAANTLATGAPTITGTAHVGETLTATPGTIADPDGITPGSGGWFSSATTTLQWIRVDGGSDSDISSATDLTYTLVAADEGKQVKVKVDFTDDDGHDESRTSDAYPAGSTVLPADSVPSDWSLIPTGLSTGDTFRLLFLSSTKRNATSTDIADYNTFVQNLAAAGHTDIQAYSAGFRVVGCTAAVDARDNTKTTYTTTDKGVPVYWLNGAKAADQYEDFYDGSWDDEVNDKNESGTNGPDTSQSGNRPFTGCGHNGTEALDGSISQGFGAAGGTKVGRPNSSFALHGPLSSNAVTGTANTRPLYGLSAVFQVAAAVVVNTPATGAPTITGTAQVGQTLTATVGTIADANGLPDPFLADANTSFQWVRVDLGTETNIASATASTYTLVREDWAASVRVKVAFQDAQGNSEGPLTSSSVIIVKPANTAATGKPGITGTAQVGQTLTATVGTSADVDGLPNPFLTDVNTSFQWIRVATDNTETNIASATASTYTLVTDDAGTTIKVKVGFADNYDYDEMLTSDATAAVAAATNTPATGAPTITGTAQVGQTLTAGTTAIMDADGLTTPSYTYQWIRVATDNSETNIASATASTYTLVDADLGTTVKVKVSFTDDASNDETLTSAATAAVSAAPNTPATGAPTITGTAQVGQTLTADTTAIVDADGLTSVSYTYQWIRTAAGVDTNISGATASTYTLVDADLGTTIKVKVSFTDDASNAETLTSDATAAVAAAPDTTPPTLTSAYGTSAGNYILLVFSENLQGSNMPPASAFTVTAGGNTVTVGNVNVSPTGETLVIGVSPLIRHGQAVVATYTDPTTGDDTAAIQDTAGNDTATFTTGMNGVPYVFNTSTVTNTPATGAPTITGTAQVGQTLTAGTTAIMDDDGLTSVSYTYQWIRVDGGTETNISGATASTHTLVAADQGTTIKVRVSFTDDASNAETLTSAATAAVAAAANTPATGAPTITGTAQVGQTLTAGTTAIMDANGLTTPSYTYQWIRVATDNSETNIASATASTYTLVDADLGTTIKVKVSFTDDASNAETLTSTATAAVAAAVPNNPPAFSADTAARSVAENTAAGQNVGAALTATDADSDTLTYTLEGADAASFDIVSGSGQIQTRTGVTYNHEAQSTYTVIVKADDSNGGTDTVTVTITVTDVDEPPGIPAAPTVTATAGSTTSLDVTWTAPANTGPDIDNYDLIYRESGSGPFTSGPQNVTGASAAIGSLAPGTAYQVQVRATNAEGDSDWSLSGTGQTGNSAPGAPTVLSATASGTTRIDLSWTAPASTGGSAITGYRIEVSSNGGSSWSDLVANTSNTTTTYAHTGLAAGETRHYRVSAINANGAGTASNVANATTGQTTVTFGASSYTAAEGGATATVAVQLSAAASASVTIPLTKTHRGGATAADYSGVPSNVTFTAGQTRQTFTVTATDDSDKDGGESVQLGFGSLPGGYAPGARRTATVTLVDDDANLIVNFGTERHTTVKVRESDTVWHRFTFSLSTSRYGPPNGNPQQPVTIPLVVRTVGGADSDDYTPIPSSVTFGVGESVTFFRMRAIPDRKKEIGEGLRLDFGPLPAGVRAGTWGPYETIEFLDEYLPDLTVWFGASSYTAAEGGADARVSIHLSEKVDVEPLVVRLSVQPGGGATSGDYSVPSSVRFAVGEQTKTIQVAAVDDTDDDDGESVTLSFVNAPNDRLITGSGPVTATVALEDNDGAGKVEVSFAAATYTATEGGSGATVRVELDKAPGRSVTVPLAVTHLGGALPADYSGIPANVTFGANQRSRTFTVTATNDTDSDGGESVPIGFGTLPDGVLAGRPAATVVTLKDGTEQTFVVSFDSSPTYATEVREGNVGKRISVFLGNDPWGSVWNAEPKRPVTIPLVVTRTGGATAADHTAIPASVTFEVGRGGAGFDVRAIPDGETETGEGLRIDFGELPPGVTKGSWGHKTIAFVDAGAAAASVSVSGPLLTLSYPGALDAGSAPSGADFVVLAGPRGGEAVVPVTSVWVDGNAVLLALARPVAARDTVTLTYLMDAMHPIRGAHGLLAAPLVDEPVRNETGIPPERAAVPDGAQAGARPERLDLSSRNLTDLSALAGLSGVRELDLRDNAIADLSPLSGLSGLQVLDLSGNRIEELWPLAGLPALQRLNLSGNRIADIGMLSGLGGLQVLDLSGNRIEELWPLAGLPALRRLNLSGNRIADIGMLSGLGGLQVLDLSGNRIEELWPLAGLPALRRLNLSGNRITDIAMLSGLGGLQVLLLDRNRVADAGALSPLTGLANLGLSENRIEDIGLLGSLGPLRRLDLSGNAVADVSALGDVSELLWLRLSGNPVSDVAPLGRLEMLRWLWLDQGAATRMEALALPAGRGAAPLWIERVPAR